ncbi:MAG: hypothetical protein OXC19_15035, partial [Bryobacterales bacterium]|nr:hypothetical protein [Bryobacterales bacterium]
CPSSTCTTRMRVNARTPDYTAAGPGQDHQAGATIVLPAMLGLARTWAALRHRDLTQASTLQRSKESGHDSPQTD